MTPITYRYRNGAEVKAWRLDSGTIVLPHYRLPGAAEPTFSPDGTNLDEPAFTRVLRKTPPASHEEKQPDRQPAEKRRRSGREILEERNRDAATAG